MIMMIRMEWVMCLEMERHDPWIAGGVGAPCEESDCNGLECIGFTVYRYDFKLFC